MKPVCFELRHRGWARIRIIKRIIRLIVVACGFVACKNTGPPHLCTLKGRDFIVDSLLGDPTTFWKKKEVGVYFFEDDEQRIKKILDIANEWKPYSGVRFYKAMQDKSDIRVSWMTKGWSSYIGTTACRVGKDTVTLSLQDIFDRPDWQIRSVVLHEFGHSLGLLHEHQHPDIGIQWEKDTLYKYYKKTYNWDPAQVDSEIIDVYTDTFLAFCEPDPHSIMIYAIPGALTKNNIEISEPLELSPLDKKYIARLYTIRKCN